MFVQIISSKAFIQLALLPITGFLIFLNLVLILALQYWFKWSSRCLKIWYIENLLESTVVLTAFQLKEERMLCKPQQRLFAFCNQLLPTYQWVTVLQYTSTQYIITMSQSLLILPVFVSMSHASTPSTWRCYFIGKLGLCYEKVAITSCNAKLSISSL